MRRINHLHGYKASKKDLILHVAQILIEDRKEQQARQSQFQREQEKEAPRKRRADEAIQEERRKRLEPLLKLLLDEQKQLRDRMRMAGIDDEAMASDQTKTRLVELERLIAEIRSMPTPD